MKEIWKKHKGAIIASILGACVSAIIVQTFNVSNLSKSFHFEQNRAILDSTRLGIGFLKQVENELNENITLLLNNDYKATFEFGEPRSPFAGVAKALVEDANSSTNTVDKAQAASASNFFNNVGDGMKVVRVNKMSVPTMFLSTDVWKHGAPEMADIDYDLLRDLSDYYMTAGQLNASIKLFADLQIQPGGSVSPEMAARLNMFAIHHNDYVAEMQKKNVVVLKDSIEKEILRLSLIRSKIVDKAQ
jgi:hypothetical protein